jgi:putative molybdopterin biosynthesis protein
MKTENQLKAIRSGRGIRAAELAQAIGISRQTIYAIEAGSFIPNTTTALQLAEALEVTVEDIFQLDPEIESPQETLTAEMLAQPSDCFASQPLRLCRVAKRMLAVPATLEPLYLPAADGVILNSRTRRRVTIKAFPDFNEQENRVLFAGCDPGISVLGEQLKRRAHTEMIAAGCSSRRALEWLKAGKVHLAGSHLRDTKTNEYNLPMVRRLFPEGGFHIVTFAIWEEGLIVRRGNPKGIRGVGDFARKDVMIINREQGTGSRDLLEQKLREAGIPPTLVRGHDNIASGHLVAALAVGMRDADCCIATRSAAKAFGLDFIPLAVERFDLVTLKDYAELPSIRALFDILNHLALRRRLEMLAGYDTRQTGKIVA